MVATQYGLRPLYYHYCMQYSVSAMQVEVCENNPTLGSFYDNRAVTGHDKTW
jgi:hypothetical protein